MLRVRLEKLLEETVRENGMIVSLFLAVMYHVVCGGERKCDYVRLTFNRGVIFSCIESSLARRMHRE